MEPKSHSYLLERDWDKHSKCKLQQGSGEKCSGALCSARECCFSLLKKKNMSTSDLEEPGTETQLIVCHQHQ